MLKQYIQPQYSGKLKLFYLHFGITGKLCLVNCPIVIWNSLACKDDQTTAFGTGKCSYIFDFWFWSKSRLRTSTSFSFSFNIKNVSTGLYQSISKFTSQLQELYWKPIFAAQRAINMTLDSSGSSSSSTDSTVDSCGSPSENSPQLREEVGPVGCWMFFFVRPMKS